MTSPTDGQPHAYSVLMFSFDGVDTAGSVVDRLKIEGALDGCEVEAEALVSRDESGKVRFHERGAAGVGATFGVATAGILGLTGGPIVLLLLLVTGGVLGGVAGHFAGRALPGDDLREVGTRLPPNSSAFLVVVDTESAEGLAERFAAEDASVLNVQVETELASAIREAITGGVTRA